MIHNVKQNLFFWLTVVFLHIVIAAPAFGQMQGSTIYSDAWGDDNYVYGSGVTDSPYNNYNHTFRAVTTMQSPNGRVSSYDTGYGSYASAFVSLSFDENDLGLYTINTDHYDYCPIVLSEIFVGSSSAAATKGVTYLCYEYYNQTGNLCEYTIANDCPVTRCKENFYHYVKPQSLLLCPGKWRVKRQWVEKQDGCGCTTNCTEVEATQITGVCVCGEIYG